MDMVIAALVVLFIVCNLVALATAVASCVRTPQATWRAAGRTKGTTAALIVATGGIGGLYYWWRIRPELRSLANGSGPAATAAELRAMGAARSMRR